MTSPLTSTTTPESSSNNTALQPLSLRGPIGILGAGNWGTALSILAAKNDQKIYLYDRDKARAEEMQRTRQNTKYLSGVAIPPNVEVISDLKKIFSECTLVFPVVPAKAFRQLTRDYAPFVRGDHFLVHGTKGLEPKTRKRMCEILAEETPCLRTGVLSGPNIAGELAKGLPGATVIASRFNEVVEAAQLALASDQLRVYGSHEPIAVEWAGALKNILALCAGIIHELGFGQNALSVMVARGIAELANLIGAMGAHSTALFGLAGVGDIFVTCTSLSSRNFQAGQLLARGKTPAEIEKELVMVVEGLNTICIAVELADQKHLDLPITRSLWEVAYGRKDVREAIRKLMSRPATYEIFQQ